MVKVHIDRTNVSNSSVLECPRCKRRNLVLRKGSKLAQHQRCSNCWFNFS